MQKSPLVSVVMPAYKHNYIAEAIDSLLAQSYSNLELIICDDSIQTLNEEKYSQTLFPVQYSKNEKRLWGFGGVEKGVKLANGECLPISW